MPSTRTMTCVAGLLAAAVAVVLLWQWQATAVLREELAGLRLQSEAAGPLREEHRRLVAAQPSPEAVEKLRSDHATVVRLQGEIERIKGELRRAADPAAKK